MPKQKPSLENVALEGRLKSNGKFEGWRKLPREKIMEGRYTDGTKIYRLPNGDVVR